MSHENKGTICEGGMPAKDDPVISGRRKLLLDSADLMLLAAGAILATAPTVKANLDPLMTSSFSGDGGTLAQKLQAQALKLREQV